MRSYLSYSLNFIFRKTVVLPVRRLALELRRSYEVKA